MEETIHIPLTDQSFGALAMHESSQTSKERRAEDTMASSPPWLLKYTLHSAPRNNRKGPR